jgi:hypothetical protein
MSNTHRITLLAYVALAVYVAAALWLVASLMFGFAAFRGIELLSQVRQGPIDQALTNKSQELANFFEAMGTNLQIAQILFFIVFISWTFQVCKAARSLTADLPVTPVFSIAWYFIPIVNLWKPLEALIQIYKASAGGGGWRMEPTPVLLIAWWALFISSRLLWIALGAFESSFQDIDSINKFFWYVLYLIPLDIAFLLATVSIVKIIEGNLSARRATP